MVYLQVRSYEVILLGSQNFVGDVRAFLLKPRPICTQLIRITLPAVDTRNPEPCHRSLSSLHRMHQVPCQSNRSSEILSSSDMSLVDTLPLQTYAEGQNAHTAQKSLQFHPSTTRIYSRLSPRPYSHISWHSMRGWHQLQKHWLKRYTENISLKE